VVVIVAVTPVYQGIYSDPAYQLKAVQQKLWTADLKEH